MLNAYTTNYFSIYTLYAKSKVIDSQEIKWHGQMVSVLNL